MDKRCTRCRQTLDVSMFAKNKADKMDGLQTWCRSCANADKKAKRAANPEKARADYRRYDLNPVRKAKKKAWTKEYIAKNPMVFFQHHLRRTYGIIAEDYTAKLAEQGGVCAMCCQPETVVLASGKVRRLAVDHCHATGLVRGLLCLCCNVVARPDDIDFLLLRVAYLRRYQAADTGSSRVAIESHSTSAKDAN